MKSARLKSWTAIAAILIAITPAYAVPSFLSAVDSNPEITTAYLDKTKYQPGDQMLITAAVLDDWGIQKVEAQIENENGWDSVTLILITGNNRKGTWQGAWKLHDTVGVKEYKTTIIATDLSGQTAEKILLWIDPVQSHPASQIKPGAFQSGDYSIPGKLGIGTDATAGDRLKVNATSGNAINAECTNCDSIYASSSGGYSGYFTGGNGVKIENGLNIVSGTVSIPVNQIDSSEVNFNYAGSGSKGGAATTALALSADGSNCAGGQYAQGVDVSGNAQGCSAPAAGISGSGTANYIPKWTGGTSLGNSIIYDNGNVGIGTTSPNPDAQLHLAKDTNSILFQTSDGGYSNTGIELVNRKGNPSLSIGDSAYIDFHVGTVPHDWDARIWYKNNKWGGSEPTGLGFFARPPSGTSEGLNNAQLFITPTGNVGIGTTSPGHKLEVFDGESYFRSDPPPSTARNAVTAQVTSNPSIAVFGENTANGRGIYGNGNPGVTGNDRSGSGTGVVGSSQSGNGVLGTSNSATGVWGGSQTGNGVYGSTNGNGASGVFGNNGGSGNGVAGISNTGTGVYGKSTSGYSGYFEGGNGVKIAGNQEITGQIKITGGSPGAGKVLTSDASGLASWQTSGGGGAASPGESVMYLRENQRHGSIASCPSGWSTASTGAISGPDSGNQYILETACYRTDAACQVMYLRENQRHGSIASCPSGWSTASTGAISGPDSGNQYILERACYLCH